MSRLAGKVAIITGGAAGMGAEHAARFVKEGARVVITDIVEDEGAAVAKRLGESVRFIRQDVTDQEQWRAVVEETTRTFGAPTVLVNNAGITRFASIIDEPVESFRQMLDINLTSVWLGIKAVAPSMIQAGGGSIINISSDAGVQAFANLSAYVSTKWAVRGLTRCAALEFGPSGIRVNAVLPGLIDTPMGRAAMGSAENAAEVASAGWALQRIGRPDEVTNLVLFLASDESSYCTGGDYGCDGGATAGDMPRAK